MGEYGVNGPHFSLTSDLGCMMLHGCAVEAFGVMQVRQDAIPALRKKPGPDVGRTLSPGMLRQADEQTVAAIAAVFQAIHDFGLQDRSFTEWAVVGAPCFPGRSGAITALEKFQRQGARVVSPLLSPYYSLHSASAMLSVGLKSLGPNLGVGGGPGAAADGLLAALTLLLDQALEGVWLVLTAWDPEPIPAAPDSNAGPPACHAAALALTSAAASRTGLRLQYLPSATAEGPADHHVSQPGAVSLARFLSDRSSGDRPRRWSCPIRGGGVLELNDLAGLSDCSAAPGLRRVEANR
jgi:hypothetical protein